MLGSQRHHERFLPAPPSLSKEPGQLPSASTSTTCPQNGASHHRPPQLLSQEMQVKGLHAVLQHPKLMAQHRKLQIYSQLQLLVNSYPKAYLRPYLTFSQAKHVSSLLWHFDLQKATQCFHTYHILFREKDFNQFLLRDLRSFAASCTNIHIIIYRALTCKGISLLHFGFILKTKQT